MKIGPRSHAHSSMFDINKAIAAVAYLVTHTGASMYPVMKMMYLADKHHLNKYGRLISGDTYCAMEKGPVPSSTYRMIQHVRGDVDDGYVRAAEEFFSYGPNHEIVVTKQPDLGELSESDLESLSEVVRVFRSLGSSAVRDLSHDDAWRRTWRSLTRARSIPIPLERIAAELDNADEVLVHLTDPEPGAA